MKCEKHETKKSLNFGNETNITINSEGGIWAADIRQEHEHYLQTVQTVTDK